MKAIITVVGKDKVGIMAGVCAVLEKINVNILDISQTVMQNMFTMNMLVDLEKANVDYPQISLELENEGESLGVSVRIQREDIFDAMHRI